MARYLTRRKEITKVDIGSMNSRIRIFIRSIVAPTGTTDVNYSESFKKYLDVWAALITPKGVQMFDNTNTVRDITHSFYIRYLPDITFENWILYKSKYYDVINVANLEEESKFYILHCSLRGTQALPTNWA